MGVEFMDKIMLHGFNEVKCRQEVGEGERWGRWKGLNYVISYLCNLFFIFSLIFITINHIMARSLVVNDLRSEVRR